MAANRTKVEGLHDLLATAFTDILKNGVKTVDKDGNTVTETPPASYLNVIRQFVKDNEVIAPALPGSPMGNLVESLPFAGDDEEDVRH